MAMTSVHLLMDRPEEFHLLAPDREQVNKAYPYRKRESEALCNS